MPGASQRDTSNSCISLPTICPILSIKSGFQVWARRVPTGMAVQYWRMTRSPDGRLSAKKPFSTEPKGWGLTSFPSVTAYSMVSLSPAGPSAKAMLAICQGSPAAASDVRAAAPGTIWPKLVRAPGWVSVGSPMARAISWSADKVSTRARASSGTELSGGSCRLTAAAISSLETSATGRPFSESRACQAPSFSAIFCGSGRISSTGAAGCRI